MNITLAASAFVFAAALPSFAGDDVVCPGLPEAAWKNCGCSPVEQSLASRYKIFNIDSTQREEVSNCINGQAKAETWKKRLFGGDVEGCIKQKVKAEPKTLQTLLKLLGDAKASVPSKRIDTWDACYEKALNSAAKPGGTQSK